MAYVDTASERMRRIERLIAGGRLVLAGFSLLAVWADPSEPADFANATYSLIAGYFVYSLAIVAVAWGMTSPGRRMALATHLFDLVMFGLVVSVTYGPSSPFFMLFVFALVNAALRWQWSGTLWTAGAALATLTGTGLWRILTSTEPFFEVDRFIIRGAHLIVVAVLLGYLAAHEKRLRGEVGRASALEERVRFAHDLHDGVVQSLTGAALRLRTLPALFRQDPETAQQTVDQIGELLAEEQRELRRFVEETRAGGQARLRPLADRLPEIFSSVERHWGLSIDWTADQLAEMPIPDALADEISKIVREAVVNSARHGQASTARLGLAFDDGRVLITVSDDGQGFPYRGRFCLAELSEQGLGPRSLMLRVAALGGDLTLDSTHSGTRLEISLPIAA